MKKYISLLILLSIFTISCSHQINKEFLKIKKGLSSEEVMSIIDDNGGTNYLSLHDNYVNEIKVSNSTNKYTMIIGRKVYVTTYQKYVYAFENNKLIYWGLPIEFARNSSPLINQIGEEAIRLLNEYDAE